ncbi:unnamed protein product [Bemisia tabaci]|uniref:Uncharacterized protein n=1 Tax=Bemisia tabaci TaxID=7038 RepID=A0A9P0ACA6_BEMTA|nr:unnamed protein product [Bemisia tabaci]
MSGTTGVSGFGKRACRTRRNNLIPNDEANRNAPAECFRSHLVTLDRMLHSPVHPPNQNNTDVTLVPISEDTIETFEVFKVSPITPNQLSITTTPFVLQNGRQIDVNVVPCNQENLNAMRVSILVNHRIPNYVLVTDTVLIERNLPKYKEQINTHRVSTSLVLKIFTDTRLLYRWLPVKLVAYAPEALRWSDSTGDSSLGFSLDLQQLNALEAKARRQVSTRQSRPADMVVRDLEGASSSAAAPVSPPICEVTDNSKLIHQVFESVKDDATRIRLITALMAEKDRTYAAQAKVIEKMTGDIRELQLKKRKLHDELSIVLAATIVIL